MKNYREYQIVGKYGHWGEPGDWEQILGDLQYVRDKYLDRDEFRLQVRTVSEWSDVDEVEEANLRREGGEGPREEEAPQADEERQVIDTS